MLQPDSSTNNATINVATDNSTVSDFTSIDVDNIPPTYVDVDSNLETASTSVVKPVISTQPAAPSFVCDGRQHCSQMTSCAEATYFSNHCPNTKMDGNHDGVPCEQQWCN
ncbi:excalibur calcium-binding domain-containing protein [Psychrobacter vallis]|uniref:excalibur calcium-binding domain-containing protein n=1 Tax=Psychrobacter vallis TaxID=248451 RepID=UPI00223489E5|nr:excalibur calcium-binding domain-containing protein [Psychrobacter vallis]